MPSIHLASRLGAMALGVGMLFASAAFADDMKMSPLAKIGDIAVLEAWARATPVKTGGAYLTLRNDGDAADRLVDASADIAEMAHLHQTIKENGVEKMRGVEGIDLPPHATVKLAPGGYHVMLMGLSKPLKAGERFPLKLTFEKAGTGTVTVSVKAAGASGMDHESMGDMDSMNHDSKQ